MFKNARIYSESEGFFFGGFEVRGDRFFRVFHGKTDHEAVEETGDFQGAYVIPGLIDLHIHGAFGADFSDGTRDGLVAMGNYLAEHGTTSFAPTSMTLPYEQLGAAFQSAVQVKHDCSYQGARLMGIHMEGPYLSEAKCGSQNRMFLKYPDQEAFERLMDVAEGMIRIVDIAPELPGAEEFTRAVCERCRVSIAHTNADYEQTKRVIEAGASHVTHLYNAMPSLHHRNPGVIPAAAECESVTAELICDGIHVHPAMVRMAYQLFENRICLISDALRCTGMPKGEYELGGQKIFLKEHVARLADGTIAGSATNLYDCMRNAIRFGIAPQDAVRSATILPARELGCEEVVGSIEEGKYADFLVCDSEWNLLQVWMGGRRIR